MYVYLEASQRYEIPNYQIIKTSLEANIMEHKEMLTQKFRQRWTHGHKCDVKGCQSVLVIDAGLKLKGLWCQAKWLSRIQGVRGYSNHRMHSYATAQWQVLYETS